MQKHKGDQDHKMDQLMMKTTKMHKVCFDCLQGCQHHFQIWIFFPFTGEANKLIADYKYKLTKSEQEIANLQASLARSETQVIRYKSTADAAEKVEAELKIERRKLQREVRYFSIR